MRIRKKVFANKLKAGTAKSPKGGAKRRPADQKECRSVQKEASGGEMLRPIFHPKVHAIIQRNYP